MDNMCSTHGIHLDAIQLMVGGGMERSPQAKVKPKYQVRWITPSLDFIDLKFNNVLTIVLLRFIPRVSEGSMTINWGSGQIIGRPKYQRVCTNQNGPHKAGPCTQSILFFSKWGLSVYNHIHSYHIKVVFVIYIDGFDHWDPIKLWSLFVSVE